MVENQCSRLKQKPVIKVLVVEKYKQCEIYSVMWMEKHVLVKKCLQKG